jgi:hypothetical protein
VSRAAFPDQTKAWLVSGAGISKALRMPQTVWLLGDRVSRRTAWRLARQHAWNTLRDAKYLTVTRLQADALVTVDPSLAATAQDVVAVAAID